MMLKVLLIAGGSAVGGVARYVVSGLVQRLGGGSFPMGTLCVNVVGLSGLWLGYGLAERWVGT